MSGKTRYTYALAATVLAVLLVAVGCSDTREKQPRVGSKSTDSQSLKRPQKALTPNSSTEDPHLDLNRAGLKIWGTYEIRHDLFPDEVWEFTVVLVPPGTSIATLKAIAKAYFAKYPTSRVRFFDDSTYIQQFVDRDRFVNDRSGSAREVAFPDEEWSKTHFLGNINNRSAIYKRHWMLEDRYGSKLVLLP